MYWKLQLIFPCLGMHNSFPVAAILEKVSHTHSSSFKRMDCCACTNAAEGKLEWCEPSLTRVLVLPKCLWGPWSCSTLVKNLENIFIKCLLCRSTRRKVTTIKQAPIPQPTTEHTYYSETSTYISRDRGGLSSALKETDYEGSTWGNFTMLLLCRLIKMILVDR